jgi:FixJ family two-component response regulator
MGAFMLINYSCRGSCDYRHGIHGHAGDKHRAVVNIVALDASSPVHYLCRALFGIARMERISFDRFLNTLYAEDRESVRIAVNNSLAGGGDYEGKYRVMLTNEKIRWLATRSHTEFNNRGLPLRMYGVSIDITRRKQAEQDVQKQRNELFHLSRLTMLGELSSSLAHELNQPLAAILSNAQAALRFLVQDASSVNEVRSILEAPQDFLDHYDQNAPGCLVLDVAMPHINGLELQQSLVSSGSELPIIFLTGHGDIPMSVRAIKQGAFDFLTKPVHDSDLIEAIHDAIEKDRIARQARDKSNELQQRLATLTPREQEILVRVVSGKKKPANR